MGMARLKFHGKTFMGGCKIAKFVKVFSFESFPLYGIICTCMYHNKGSLSPGVFIQRNGTMEWNGGMERWNWSSGMTTPTECAL